MSLSKSSKKEPIKKFTVIFFWEFIQNVPLVLGFLFALQSWRQTQWGLAIICAVIGSTVGALLIGATESKIISGHKEPFSVVITNIFVISLLMIGVVYYLSSEWSNRITDLVIGGAIGLVLGTVQSLAAKQSIDFIHCLALALSTTIILLIIRFMTTTLSMPINTILITVIVTFIIVLVDYIPSYTNNVNEV